MIEWSEADGILRVDGRSFDAGPAEDPYGRGKTTVKVVPLAGLAAVIWLNRDGTAGLSLWKNEAGDPDGVAVLADNGFPHAVAHIPLCGCGDRGCGNHPIQLDEDPLDEPTLRSTLEVLERLHWDGRPATRKHEVWHPKHSAD